MQRVSAGRAVLPATLLISVAIAAAVRTTGSATVLMFAAPVVVLMLGTVLASNVWPGALRPGLRAAAVAAFAMGIVTIFSVGILFLATGGLLLWAVERVDRGGERQHGAS
jgi:hypothetical protein